MAGPAKPGQVGNEAALRFRFSGASGGSVPPLLLRYFEEEIDSMLFWLREIAGWVMVLAAIFMLFLAAKFAMNEQDPQIIQAGLMVFAGTSVLRAGILLVRVSTAARVVNKADEQTAVAKDVS